MIQEFRLNPLEALKVIYIITGPEDLGWYCVAPNFSALNMPEGDNESAKG